MRVRYTFPASTDLEEVLGDLAAVSPQAARRIAIRIKDVEQLLAQFPNAGAITRLSWLRRIKVRGYPFLIFYEITFDTVLIHAVRHGARKPLDDEGTI